MKAQDDEPSAHSVHHRLTTRPFWSTFRANHTNKHKPTRPLIRRRHGQDSWLKRLACCWYEQAEAHPPWVGARLCAGRAVDPSGPAVSLQYAYIRSHTHSAAHRAVLTAGPGVELSRRRVGAAGSRHDIRSGSTSKAV
eukprot:748289-Prymnesium_polylepis.2